MEVRKMKETEKQDISRMPFSFVCPIGKEEVVFELFENLSLGVLDSGYREGTRVSINPDNGEAISISGYLFSGITDIDKIDLIIKELASQKIAGYSRATQVFFKVTPNEKN
jgi:hypothetical protein